MSLHKRYSKLQNDIVNVKHELYVDCLLDTVTSIFYDGNFFKILEHDKNFQCFSERYANSAADITECRINTSDFDIVKLIGQGGFGKVQLVRHRETSRVFAMKVLNKFEMIKQGQTATIWSERNIMAHANSEWVIKLFYSFQDPKYLYMVMEYLPGGDLELVLNTYDNYVSEDFAKFYLTELVLALEVVHGLGYVHRDIKPSNMLLDRNGHLKLADFGTCVKLDNDGLTRAQVNGTPDYLSPEMVTALKKGKGAYGTPSDWWAVGIFLYEMLVGDYPFYDESLGGTYNLILKHAVSLEFPDDIVISADAENLIRSFLASVNLRLGINGIQEVKAHPFFESDSYNWSNIRNAVAAHVPNLADDEEDAAIFGNPVPEPEREEQFDSSSVLATFSGNQLPFVGFTYSSDVSLIPVSDKQIDDLMNNNRIYLHNDEGACLSCSELQGKVQHLEKEKAFLEEELQNEMVEKDEAEANLLAVNKKFSKLSADFDEKLRQQADLAAEAKRNMEENFQQIQFSSLKLGVENRSLSKKVDELEREKLQISEKLAEKLDRIDELKSEIERLRVSHETASRGLQQQVDELLLLKNNFEQDLLALRTSLAEEVEEKSKLAQTVDSLLKQNTTWKVQNELLSKELASSASTLQLVQNQVVGLTESKTDLEMSLRKLRQRLGKGNQKNSFDFESIDLVEQQAEMEVARLHRSIALMEMELNSSVQKYRELEDAYHISQLKVTDVEQALAEERKKFAVASIRLASTEEKIAQLKEYERYAMVEKRESADVLACLRRAVEDGSTEIKELREKIESETQLSKMALAQVQLLNVRLDEMTANYELVQNDIHMIKADRDCLSAQVQVAEAQAGSEQLARVMLEEQVADYKHEKELLETKLATFRRSLSTMSSQEGDAAKYQKKIKELEEIIKKKDQDLLKLESTKSGFTDEAAIKLLRKELIQERKLKVAAVEKLEKIVLTESPSRPLRRKPSSKETRMDVRRKLQMDKERYKQAVSKYYQDQINEIMNAWNSSKQEKQKLQMELETSKATIVELQGQIFHQNQQVAHLRLMINRDELDVPDSLSGVKKMEGWLSVPVRRKKSASVKGGWRKQYVVLAGGMILFFVSEEDRRSPSLILDLSKVFHVRSVTHADVIRADSKDIPKIFQILYAHEGESSSSDTEKSDGQSQVAHETMFRGHNFDQMHYHVPTQCDLCPRPMWNLLRPPDALECQQCRMKCHQDHIDRVEDIVHECKVAVTAKKMLLLASTPEEQRLWVESIMKKIAKVQVKAKPKQVRNASS